MFETKSGCNGQYQGIVVGHFFILGVFNGIYTHSNRDNAVHDHDQADGGAVREEIPDGDGPYPFQVRKAPVSR